MAEPGLILVTGAGGGGVGGAWAARLWRCCVERGRAVRAMAHHDDDERRCPARARRRRRRR